MSSFTSVLNSEQPGLLEWREFAGVVNEALGPIKQRIVDQVGGVFFVG